jgi:cholinesterase
MMNTRALQAYGEAMGGGNHTYSEDCLGINIWTKPQSGEAKKAVLLWIHGGGFSSGTPHATFMDGARFAEEQDVVLVSASYRINVMGFPNAPGLSDQNVGLLDQRAAVEWVRDNIEDFGGDATRITIFGESAGGAAVDMYAYSWAKLPIINGIIAQSGAVGASMPSLGGPNAAWYQLSKAMGCGGADIGNKTVDCMRRKTIAEINQQLNGMAIGPGMTAFTPAADGKVVFSDTTARIKRGHFARVVCNPR